MASKRKCVSLSLADKLNIIEQSEKKLGVNSGLGFTMLDNQRFMALKGANLNF